MARWRKKIRGKQSGKDPNSVKRRKINELIQQKKFSEALIFLDEWVAQESDPRLIARCLILVGESQWKRALYVEAASIFEKAYGLVEKTWSEWLTPAFGEVRSWLAAQDSEKAHHKAERLLSYAQSREKDYEIYLLQASQELQQKGELLIENFPPDSGEVALRLAEQFFRYGYRDIAQFYYEQALPLVKAKLGLAQLALDQNDFKVAIQLSGEALQEGNFGSKTLRGWPIFITSNIRSHKKINWLEWTQKLERQAETSIRARATVVIVRTLRNYHQPEWLTLAEAWLKQGSDIATAAELRKLILNHARQSQDWTQQKISAQALLTTPKLAPQEWVCGVKSLLLASASLNQPLVMDQLQQQAKAIYPEKYLPTLYHGFAVACLEAGKAEWGEPWLELNLNALAPSEIHWQKAAYRLAEIAEIKENFSRAIELWMRLALTPEIILRDRLFAFIGWGKAAAKASALQTIPNIAIQFRVAVAPIEDYSLLLDLSRQLIYAPEALNQLEPELLNKGLSLGFQAFQTAKTPEKASSILWRLTRAQSEAGENRAIIQFWEGLSAEKKEWLWNLTGNYWDYLAYVFRAYPRVREFQKATQLAQTLIAEPTTPPSARAQLTVLWGLMEMKEGKVRSALHRLAQGVELSPQHPIMSHAHYWFALKAYAQGSKRESQQKSDQVLRSLGFDVVNNKHLKKLWLKTQWIRCDLQEDKFPHSYQGKMFSEHEKSWTLEEVKKDLAKFRS